MDGSSRLPNHVNFWLQGLVSNEKFKWRFRFFFLRDSWLETWLGWDLWWNVMQPTYGKYTAAILWLRLLLLFPRMLEYAYFKSISQHESGQAKGLKVVYVCKVFGAQSWLMVAIVAWPSNLSLRGIREFSGFKINIYDHWF